MITNIESAYRSNMIEATSYISDKPNDLFNDSYDLLFVASSWDRRAICLTECSNLRSEASLFLDWELKDSEGIQERNSTIINDYLREHSSICYTVKGKSIEPQSMLPEIFRYVLKVLQKSMRPLRIAIDLSVCPRIYSLSLATVLLKKGLAETIDFFYAEAKYSPIKGDAIEFRAGPWQLIPITLLDGQNDPWKNKFFLVSVGFEGHNTLKVLNKRIRIEFRFSFLIPDIYPNMLKKQRIKPRT